MPVVLFNLYCTRNAFAEKAYRHGSISGVKEIFSVVLNISAELFAVVFRSRIPDAAFGKGDILIGAVIKMNSYDCTLCIEVFLGYVLGFVRLFYKLYTCDRIFNHRYAKIAFEMAQSTGRLIRFPRYQRLIIKVAFNEPERISVQRQGIAVILRIGLFGAVFEGNGVLRSDVRNIIYAVYKHHILGLDRFNAAFFYGNGKCCLVRQKVGLYRMLAYSPGVLILVILIPTDSVAQSADVYYRLGSAPSAYRIYIRRVFVTLAFKNGTVIKGDSIRQSECSRVISQYSGIIYVHFMLINGIVVHFEASYGITYNRYTELTFSTRNARFYPVGIADGPNIVAVYIQFQLIAHIIDGCFTVIRGYNPAVLHGYCKGRTNIT